MKLNLTKPVHGGYPDATRGPIVLVALDDPRQKPKLYACRGCGTCYSVKTVGAQARDLAENCTLCNKKQYICDTCSCETPQYWTRCRSCRETAKLEAAAEVPDDGGPYFEFGGDRYYHELDEAADDGIEWVAPCTITYPRINADDVLENLLNDMHEDASVDDLVATEPFIEAVKAFNDAQTQRTFWADEKRKIRVPAREAECAA